MLVLTGFDFYFLFHRNYCYCSVRYKYTPDLADKTYQDWMDIDRDLQCYEEYSEDLIICKSISYEATRNNEGEYDESVREEVEVVLKPPSNKEVPWVLDVFRRAIRHRGINLM